MSIGSVDNGGETSDEGDASGGRGTPLSVKGGSARSARPENELR
jgi:hypothetical protein